MKKLLALVLVVCAVCTTMLTSCNDSDTNADKAVVIGYTLYEPMNYMDADNNLVGFDTELAEAVFEKLGYTVVFKEIKWANKYTDLASGSINCIWNGFTANCADDDGTQRKDKVDFSYNYMVNYQAVVVRSSDAASITGKDSFASKIGYVEADSAGATYAAELTDAIVNTTTTQTEALMQVKSNAAFFAVVDAQLAKSVVGKGDYSELTSVDAVASETEYYAIGFKKGSDMTAKVNSTLEELAADGTIMRIAQKYGVDEKVITDFSSQK